MKLSSAAIRLTAALMLVSACASSFAAGGKGQGNALEWTPIIAKQGHWDSGAQGRKYCETAAINGRSGWRLPTIQELERHLREAKAPTGDTEYIDVYSSTTPRDPYSGQFCTVKQNGDIYGCNSANNYGSMKYLVCVRGEPSPVSAKVDKPAASSTGAKPPATITLKAQDNSEALKQQEKAARDQQAREADFRKRSEQAKASQDKQDAERRAKEQREARPCPQGVSCNRNQ